MPDVAYTGTYDDDTYSSVRDIDPDVPGPTYLIEMLDGDDDVLFRGSHDAEIYTGFGEDHVRLDWSGLYNVWLDADNDTLDITGTIIDTDFFGPTYISPNVTAYGGDGYDILDISIPQFGTPDPAGSPTFVEVYADGSIYIDYIGTDAGPRQVILYEFEEVRFTDSALFVLPDLIPQDASIDVEATAHNPNGKVGEIRPGDVIDARFITWNQGNGQAPSPLKAAIFLSRSQEFTSDSIIINEFEDSFRVPPSGGLLHASEVIIPVNLGQGEWYVGFTTDHTREITESNDSNNVFIWDEPFYVGGEPEDGVRDPMGTGTRLTVGNDGDGYYVAGAFQENNHLGVDWNGEGGDNTDDGEKVFNIYHGTVSAIIPQAGHPNSVHGWGGVVMVNYTMDDGKGYTAVYAHLENINETLEVGKTIPEGTILGDLDDIDAETSGGPGFSKYTPFWAHLHFEIREGHQDKTLLGAGYGAPEPGNSGTVDDMEYVDITIDEKLVRYFDPIDFAKKYRGKQTSTGIDEAPGETVGTQYTDEFELRTGDTSATLELVADGIDAIIEYLEGGKQFTLKLFEEIKILVGTAATTLNLNPLDGTTILNDTVRFDGGPEGDTVNGGSADRRIIAEGGDGNDTLTGGSRNDIFFGDAGSDTLGGGAGNDWLAGGHGVDSLTGGEDSDIFAFDASHGDGGGEITDLTADDYIFFGNQTATPDFAVDGQDVLVNAVRLVGSASGNVSVFVQAGGGMLSADGAEAIKAALDGGFGALPEDYSHIEFDANGNDAWHHITRAYKAGGVADLTTVKRDNGTSQSIDYDQDESQSWHLIYRNYTAVGRMDTAIVNNDNGTRRNIDFDQDNTYSWASIHRDYTSGGAYDFATVIKDNGARLTIDYDQANTANWSTIQRNYTPDGKYDSATVNFDNGRWQTIDYDQEHNASWSTIYRNYAASGQSDHTTVIADNGSSLTIDYDHDDTQPWWLTYDYFTAGGDLDIRDVHNDDTSRIWTDFDQDDAHPWERHIIEYDSIGNVVNDYFL